MDMDGTMSMAGENYAVVFVERGKVALEARALPAFGAQQVLIRTRVSLISPGTERAWFLGMPNTPGHYPQNAGYSNIGTVVAVGNEVRDLAVGQRVATPAHHAAYVVVDAEKAVPVPDGLADERAVFFNLSSIALQGVRKARIEIGEPVVVLGAGLIGLLASQLARINGGLPVLSVDRDHQRLEFAREVGADSALVADDQLAAAVMAATGGEGAEVVIEATGTPPAILTAFELARFGGRVILLGSTRGETEKVNFYADVHKKGLTVVGAHDNTRPRHESAAGWWTQRDDQKVALELLARDRLAVEPLITHRYAWRDAASAYELLTQWDLTALGMVLDWRDGDNVVDRAGGPA